MSIPLWTVVELRKHISDEEICNIAKMIQSPDPESKDLGRELLGMIKEKYGIAPRHRHLYDVWDKEKNKWIPCIYQPWQLSKNTQIFALVTIPQNPFVKAYRHEEVKWRPSNKPH